MQPPVLDVFDWAFAVGGLIGLVAWLLLSRLLRLIVGALADKGQQFTAYALDDPAQILQTLGVARARHDRLAYQPRHIAALVGKGAQLWASFPAKRTPWAAPLVTPVTAATFRSLRSLAVVAVMPMRAEARVAKWTEPRSKASAGTAEWEAVGALLILGERLPSAIANRVDFLALDNFYAYPAAIFEQLERWINRARAWTIEAAGAILHILNHLVPVLWVFLKQAEQRVFEVAAPEHARPAAEIKWSASHHMVKWPSKKRPTEEWSAKRPAKWRAERSWSPVIANLFINCGTILPLSKISWLLRAAPAKRWVIVWSKHPLLHTFHLASPHESHGRIRPCSLRQPRSFIVLF
jgi:hypothetical protein